MIFRVVAETYSSVEVLGMMRVEAVATASATVRLQKFINAMINTIRLLLPSLLLLLASLTAQGEGNQYISESPRPAVSVSTNLLYDAAALPSVGAELSVGRRWSVTADWTYGWWSKNASHRYWRAYGGDLGVRWWLTPREAGEAHRGHHFGVYGGIVTYDFEFGGRGYMGGKPGGNIWQRCNRMAGIEYGYTLPLSRRLSMDFTLGVGYLGGTYLEYEPKDIHYVWESTHKLKWFGPTKAEISLVWLLGGRTHRP